MKCFGALKNMKKKCEKCNENVPTAMPQPQATRALQSSPPSFNTSMKPIHPITRITNNRTRTLSAPSALAAAEQDALTTMMLEGQEKSKRKLRFMKEQHSPSPQPLPLPSAQGSVPLKLKMASGPLYASGSTLNVADQDIFDSVQHEEQEWFKRRLSNPLPLPLPSPPVRGSLKAAASSSKSGTAADLIRCFRYEEIAAACHNFSLDRCMSECLSSTIYKASFSGDASNKKLKATVSLLHPSNQDLRGFLNEVSTLSNLQHPNLCKLIGFYANDCSEPRMLVYERLSNGSLDHLLFGRSGGPSIDWNTRMKIAISAAEGLTFLHEEGPFQAMYNDFSATNIQIDIDFNAKLSGYGFVGHIAEGNISSSSSAAANLPVETLKKGMLTPKSNVWSFGIVLLELLTGRKSFDKHLPEKERNLVKWCRPILADDFQLSVIMDSQLEGRFPPKAARTVAGIVQRCLQREPSKRPTMRAIVENLKMIIDMQYPSWFPLQEPSAMNERYLSKSPSVNGIINAPRLSFSPPSLPSIARSSLSHPPRWSTVPTMVPSPLGCSYNVSNEELTKKESEKSSSSVSKKASG